MQYRNDMILVSIFLIHMFQILFLRKHLRWNKILQFNNFYIWEEVNMRKKFILGKKKAVVTSVLTVVIMCLASTAVPTIHGYKAVEIKTNMEKTDFIDQDTFENAISIFEKQFCNENNNKMSRVLNFLNPKSKDFSMDKLMEFSYSDFSKIHKVLGSPDLTRSGMLKTIINKIIPFYQEMRNIANGDKPINEINPEITSMMEQLDSEFKASPTYNPNSDFDDYWAVYSDATELWAEKGFDNYEDWFEATRLEEAEFISDNWLPFISSFILCVVGSASAVPIVSIIGWVMLAFIFYQFYDLMMDIIDGYSQFGWLQWYEIDILVYVYDDEDGTGIDGLWEKEGIEAKSTDGCSASSDNSKFTYYFGEAKGEDKPGYYSSKNRNEAEGQPRYKKAPCPPGNWTIEIKESIHYNASETYYKYNIPLNSHIIIEIPLGRKS